MGRTFIGGAVVFAAFALANPAAEARDEKSGVSAARASASSDAMRQEAAAVAMRQDAADASAVLARRAPGADPFASESDATALVRERRKPLTLFRFNTSVGEVAVQPVFGAAKGAQLSFGF